MFVHASGLGDVFVTLRARSHARTHARTQTRGVGWGRKGEINRHIYTEIEAGRYRMTERDTDR